MDKICATEKCCGCGLCSVKCPSDAIAMQPDDEGFMRPSINKSICISCGLCQKICPINKFDSDVDDSFLQQGLEYPIAYSAYKEEIVELLKSSAGGVANAISRTVIEFGGVVFGVKYSLDYRKAEYYIAKTIEELDVFNESKYVESDRRFLFEHIEEALRKYSKVLVIGLPCDIAAVRSLVGYPDNLYTCRLICRSNTSVKALSEFLNRCEEEAESKISRVSLRYKEIGRPTLPTRYRIDFENGAVKSDDFTKSDYGKAFQILARPSCLNCVAKRGNVEADLYIGDFQGINPSDELYQINGVSLVFCFSDKGQELLEKSSGLRIEKVDFENTWRYNWMMYTSIPESPFRKEFSENFISKGLRYTCHELASNQNAILDRIKSEFINTGKPVAIWGAGDTADYLYDRLEMDKWNIVKVFDGSKMKHGKYFRGFIIEDIDSIGKMNNIFEVLVLMIPSEDEKKLEDILKKKGYQGRSVHVGKYKFYREES